MKNFKITLSIVAILLLLAGVSVLLGWTGQAADVAKDEFGPKKAVEKYEWFINQANNINSMDQNISNLQQQQSDMHRRYIATYGKEDGWNSLVQMSYMKEVSNMDQMISATIAQRNNLVGDYNAQSSKFTWAPFETDPRLPKKQFKSYNN